MIIMKSETHCTVAILIRCLGTADDEHVMDIGTYATLSKLKCPELNATEQIQGALGIKTTCFAFSSVQAN